MPGTHAPGPPEGIATPEGIRMTRMDRLLHAVRQALEIGLIIGLAEALYLTARFAFVPRPDWAYSLDALWMTPLATAAALLIFAVPIGAASIVLPTWLSPARVTLLVVFPAVYALVRGVFESIHPVAALVLAGGAASAVASVRRAVDPSPRSPAGWRTIGILLGVVALFAVSIRANETLATRRAERGVPPARPGLPNVLLLILDTVGGSSVSLNGYERHTTPELERFGQGAFVFERAIAASSWTLPSHASFFTGVWPDSLSADWAVPLSDERATLAEVLSARGFSTAGFVANVQYTSRRWGLGRGFQHYEDHPISVEMAALRSSLALRVLQPVRRRLGREDLLARKNAGDVNRSFLQWLDGRDTGRPFFAFLNYYDAHEPYLPPPPYDTRFTDRPLPTLDPWEQHPDSTLDRYRATYDGAIAYLDAEIGRLLDQLQARGLLETTIVIITSDHGEEFGLHGVIDHGSSLFFESLHVPLAIRVPPSIPEYSGEGRFDETVSLRDLPSTILGLIGEEASILPGAPLTRLIRPGSAAPLDDERGAFSAVNERPWAIPDWFPISNGDMRSVVLDSIHYIRDGKGAEQVFNIFVDPLELRDVRPFLDSTDLREFRRRVGVAPAQ